MLLEPPSRRRFTARHNRSRWSVSGRASRPTCGPAAWRWRQTKTTARRACAWISSWTAAAATSTIRAVHGLAASTPSPMLGTSSVAPRPARRGVCVTDLWGAAQGRLEGDGGGALDASAGGPIWRVVDEVVWACHIRPDDGPNDDADSRSLRHELVNEIERDARIHSEVVIDSDARRSSERNDRSNHARIPERYNLGRAAPARARLPRSFVRVKLLQPPPPAARRCRSPHAFWLRLPTLRCAFDRGRKPGGARPARTSRRLRRRFARGARQGRGEGAASGVGLKCRRRTLGRAPSARSCVRAQG